MQDDCVHCGEVFNVDNTNSNYFVYGFTPEMSHFVVMCPRCGRGYAVFSPDIEKAINTALSLKIKIQRNPVPPENIIALYREIHTEKVKPRVLEEHDNLRVTAFQDQLRNLDYIREYMDKFVREAEDDAD